jgi:surfeit locus 1 family protein
LAINSRSSNRRPLFPKAARRIRTAAAVTIALIVAGVCVSLGRWQLERLADRRKLNTAILSRINNPIVDATRILNPDSARFQRVTFRGTFDYDNEIVLMLRARNGSPGVNIVTPMRIAGRDTAILVNRGWVYSPDAVTVDLTKWREPVNVDDSGYVEVYSRREGNPLSPTHKKAYRWLDPDALRGRFPYPLARYYVVATTPGPVETTPARLALPRLDEGPHRSYAIQWFSFAAISIIGMLVLLRRTNGGTPASAGE